MTHKLPARLVQKHAPVNVLVVGCGGTGSAIASGLPYLHQAMLAGGHPHGLHVVIMDGDRISPTNCVRQPFGVAEIGLHKAVVLVNRLNVFYGLNWTAVPSNLKGGSLRPDRIVYEIPDLVIGCVDTRKARANIASACAASAVHYWLDIGNTADSGQFILGEPANQHNPKSAERLRTVAELYPEIVNATLDDDSLPSCSAAEALERQEPFINQVLANSALAMLARLFRHGEISHHGAFYNAATGKTVSLAVDPEAWKRVRKVA